MKKDNTSAHGSIEYDNEVRKTIPYYDLFHQETIGLLKATNKTISIWLDTGCGTGTLVSKAYQYFDNTTFHLTDPSESMLNLAKKKLKDYDRVSFLEPLTTQSLSNKLNEKVDVLTAIQCHHYLSKEEREKATSTCFDLLNKDGIYITFENIRPLSNEGCQIGKDKWKEFQVCMGKDNESAEKHIDRFDIEYFPITVDEHIELLKKAGFGTVEILWYSNMQAGFYSIK